MERTKKKEERRGDEYLFVSFPLPLPPFLFLRFFILISEIWKFTSNFLFSACYETKKWRIKLKLMEWLIFSIHNINIPIFL